MAFELRKVLISDEVDPKCVDVLKTNGIEVVQNTKLTKEQLLEEIPKYDGLIVRSATKVTADVIHAGTNLKIIGRAGTGVDNIDCDAATARGIIVMNTPGGNTLSAAEHTCTLIISLTRDIARAAHSMKEGRWDRKTFMGIELNGKTLAIIGLGRIGREVALRMQSFGMTTIGFDPIIGPEVAAEFNTEWLPLDNIWPIADFITVHTPLIPATTNLINDAVFAKCKKGVRVVNCARGGIIDEEALLRALESGQCGGAGLDVFVEEPPKDLRLVKHPKVTATPHLGANTEEAQSRVAVEIADQFVDLAQGKRLLGAINAHALCNALSASTQPWVKLGESLGVLVSLLAPDDKATNFHIQTTGALLADSGPYLSASLLAGYMQSSSATVLNLISAPAIAKQKGLKVVTSHQDGVVPSVSVSITTPSGELKLWGSVGAGVPLLTGVQDCRFVVPACLQGPVLVFKATPSPALISKVVDCVSKSGASLVGLSLSSTAAKGGVYGVLNLSAALENGLDALREVVLSVNQVCL